VRGPLAGAQLAADGFEGPRIFVVAIDVTQHAAQFLEGGGIESAVLLDAVERAGAELIERPAGVGNADHGDIQVAPLRHGLQRREDLFPGEITGGTEEHQGVGMRICHLRFR
jgi:hypothetical protein